MTLLLRDQDCQRLVVLMALHLPGISGRIYGSRGTAKAHAASDLDLALMTPDAQPILFSQLEDFRQALSDSNIPILVDTRDWARPPESFHTEIEKAFVQL